MTDRTRWPFMVPVSPRLQEAPSLRPVQAPWVNGHDRTGAATGLRPSGKRGIPVLATRCRVMLSPACVTVLHAEKLVLNSDRKSLYLLHSELNGRPDAFLGGIPGRPMPAVNSCQPC